MNNSQSTTAQSATWLDNKTVQWLVGLVTFTLVFVYHSYPLELSDFWWHLNTGRWIWVHGAMPIDDPFLFSSVSPLDARASLILRGYPLSQLLFFGVYSVAGAYGLLVLKSLLMTLFYGLLWNHLRRSGLHPILACALVGLLPLLFFRFDELRPQVFSFIFTLVVLQLIQHVLARGRRNEPVPWHVLALLPVTMLLWANLHRGFIIGMGMLMVYLGGEWLARRQSRDPLPDETYRRFLIVVLVALALSFCNPVGVTATWASFSEVSGPFAKVIDEFLGTLKYFEFHGIRHIGYLVVAIAVIPCLALLFRWRQLSLVHVLLLGAFVTAGIMSFRFSLLMVALVLIIASGYFAPDINRWSRAAKSLPLIVVWCVATGVLANAALGRTALTGSPLESGAFPSAAVDYLQQSRPNGNIYNPFEYGGFLSWQLYPQKIFIDQRNLSWDSYEEYSQAWRGDYAGVFSKYQIGAVIYPVRDRATGKPSRLVAGLLNDRQWAVGHYDGRDIVFIRPDINSHLAVLDKQQVVMNILRSLRGR